MSQINTGFLFNVVRPISPVRYNFENTRNKEGRLESSEFILLVQSTFRGFDVWMIYLFKVINGDIVGTIDPQGLVDWLKLTNR